MVKKDGRICVLNTTTQDRFVPVNAFKVGTSDAALRPCQRTILIWKADRYNSVTSRARVRTYFILVLV